VEIGETFFAVDRAAWRSWLHEHDADGDAIWLVLLKKGVPGRGAGGHRGL